MLDENRKRNVVNAARQLAESGKFESVVELEATFIMQGHADIKKARRAFGRGLRPSRSHQPRSTAIHDEAQRRRDVEKDNSNMELFDKFKNEI